MASPMKQREPLTSVITDNSIPLLKVEQLNVNVLCFRLMARVCYVGPLMLNDKGSKSTILRFRLLDNTGEISAVAYSTSADELAKKLKFDSIFEFQVVKQPSSTFEVVKIYEGQLWINFNFKSLAKPMGEVRGIPSVIYSDLNNVTSTIPESGERFNVVVELLNCLPCCGPDNRYEVMQQEFRVKDYSKSDVDLTIKGNDLVKRLKAFQPNSEKVFVVRILQGRLNAIFDDELNQIGNFIAIDQVEADVKILSDDSPLRKSFMKKRIPTIVAPTKSKKTHDEVANTGDDSGYENTPKKNKPTEAT